MSFKISSVIDYNRFIAVDVGSSKIKALICSIENGDLHILGSSVFRQSKKNSMDGEIADLYGVSEWIKKAIAKAWEHIENIPKDMVISLSSSSMLYDTINMNYVRENASTPITMEEIDSIIKKVEYKSLERVKIRSESRIEIPDSEMRLVTTSITSINLDGQKLTNPIGFTGKNVKLGIINIFIPLSHSNILQGIGRSLGKNIISLIPLIITLPKIIEERNENFDFNCFLDFGNSKTTIVLQNNGEILGWNVLNFWFSLLEDEFKRREPRLWYLDIENIITHPEKEYSNHKEVFDTFFCLLFDAILVSMQDITKQIYLKNIFISGGWATSFLEKKLQDYFEEKHMGGNPHITSQFFNAELIGELNIHSPSPRNSWKLNTTKDDQVSLQDGEGSEKIENSNSEVSPIFTNVISLAKTTQEMLLLKKDPIARILRYIIYRYE